MATISELVDDVAHVMREPREVVNTYARALLDADLLPKSRGRAIAQAEPVHIIRLFLVIALRPKIKDAAATVMHYGALRGGGAPESLADHTKTLEEFLVGLWNVLMTDDAADLRPVYREAVMEFVETVPEGNIKIGGQTFRFLETGANPGHWQGYFKRSAILHARAFIMMGFRSGRSYREDADG